MSDSFESERHFYNGVTKRDEADLVYVTKGKLWEVRSIDKATRRFRKHVDALCEYVKRTNKLIGASQNG